MTGKAIFLNGVSSAGKTTLAKALQNKSCGVFYHLRVDDFVRMAGERACEEDLTRVLIESVANFAHTARAFCTLGRNVIIDTVCVNDGVEMLSSLIEAMKGYPVLLVKVDCDIDELEKREKLRGDRDIGQARWQVGNSHSAIPYDITVNTSRASVESCAEDILVLFDDAAKWKGFRALDPADYKYSG